MNNEEYWRQRAEQRLIEAEQIALRAEQEIKQAFDQANKEIEAQIYLLYGKYATDNGLSYADTLAYLTNNEQAEFQRDLAFYIEKCQDDVYRAQNQAYLQALAVRARVQRLEAYKAQLMMIAEDLYHEKVIPTAIGAIDNVVHDSYLKGGFDLAQGMGIMLAFNMPATRIIDQVLEYPWSGKNFSQKWYDNCADFERILDETLTKGLITGASNQRVAKELQEKTGASYQRAIRLVRTETNYAHNQAGAALAEELGIKKYKFLATLDIKTSAICRSLDSKIFDYADKQTGLNYPPMHPWCRSTKTDIVYEDEIGTRVARDVNGKPVKVPSNMSYQEWYDQHVKSNPDYLRQEQMYKNRHADKKQYERYHETLKDSNMLKSFEEFQEMKYNGGAGWKALQEQYRRIGLNERGKGKVTEITDSAINNVPKVAVQGFNAEQNLLIQQEHRNLLEFSRVNNNHNEVAYILSEDLKSRAHQMGKSTNLEFNNDVAVKMLASGNSLFVMHNHPGNSTFSMADMQFFINNDNVRHLSIVKNNGGVEIITKGKDYDRAKIITELKRLVNKNVKIGSDSEYDKVISQLIRKSKGGIVYNE